MSSSIHKDAIKAATMVNPTHFLEASGFKVRKEGRHYSVRDSLQKEVYRLTKKDDGRFLFCDKTGTVGGDNIKLVMTVSGVSFTDAVKALVKADISFPSAALHSNSQADQPTEQRQPPRVPPASSHDQLVGREYLSSRGISESTIAYAESCNMVRYCNGGVLFCGYSKEGSSHDQLVGREYLSSRGISESTIAYAESCNMVRYCNGGVLFCGYSKEGTIENVTKRATNPNDPVQKRDFKGSDKSFPAVLNGISQKVWIVEGGTDALALRDIALRQGDAPPTIIVSGGANAVSFLQRPHIKEILSQAEKVTIAHENEKNLETQARTDAAHHKQGELIKKLTNAKVVHWKPHDYMGKDIAEANQYMQIKGETPFSQRLQRAQRLQALKVQTGYDR